MPDQQPNGNVGDHSVHATAADTSGSRSSPAATDTTTNVVTYGAIGVGIALIEASLIPGMLIGAALALAPKFAPNIGEALGPIFRGTVRGVYKVAQKTREIIAEAGEQVQDMMAEARLEEAQAAKAAAEQARATKV
jgi:hypothetical protein